MKVIDFSSQELSNDDLKNLSSRLEKVQEPFSIDLSDNNITMSGLVYLTTLIKLNPNIISINIAYNPIRLISNNREIFELFCAAIASSNIKTLNLSGLRYIGDEGFECLVDALLRYRNGILTTLILTNIGITDNSSSLIQQLLIENFTLKSLLLNKNRITEKQLDGIFHAYSNNFFLKELDLSHNFDLSTLNLVKKHKEPATVLSENKMNSVSRVIRVSDDAEIHSPLRLYSLCVSFFVRHRESESFKMLEKLGPSSTIEFVDKISKHLVH